MIHFEILPEEEIAIIHPSGALESSDFKKLAAEIDACIREKGTLKGLIIHTKSFPGWKNLSAFANHVQFVRNHHRYIKRIAAVTDSKFMSLAPKIAGCLVAPEMKHFNFDDFAEAIKWIQETG